MKVKQFILAFALTLVLFACKETNEKPIQETENQAISNSDSNSTAEMSKTQTADTNVTSEKAALSEASQKLDAEGDALTNKYKGYVVNLGAYMSDRNDMITAEAAQKLLSRGQILGFYANNQVYLVYNTDGTYASSSLAKISGKSVVLTASMKEIDGTSFLVAQKFD